MLERVKKFIGMNIKKEISEFTVIGKRAKFEGKINTSNLYVEGEFYPTEACSFEKLQISSSGVFCNESADVVHTAETVEIAGTFNGTLVADNIHLLSGAIVSGTITYRNNFSCEEEVVLNTIISINQKVL